MNLEVKGFDAMDFDKLKQRYANKLEALAEFPVWTVEQIKEILNLDFNTIQKFVTAGWLCKFTVSRCTSTTSTSAPKERASSLITPTI